ncbi:NAD(P)H-dependent oxidoreductase [uncultured Aquimonas sp.]|jgi:NAD(P)H-dependent FMN reductase|uniref:flavodoxin family protein n=1 Tax=uncultured Aquimonas sp. TaxID=385483 RepID=UPI00086BE857|nr:NAD(P)H-dependent oxidoreductase [uncultured Aquimonas sp.]ODU43758.1 MAG: flavodoxin [Xanthomonadaceae bacterium SCN 69-123]
MKPLLILHAGDAHGTTTLLVDAFSEGARSAEPALPQRRVPALTASADVLLDAGAVLFATPEKFGYMAGALKHYFDRSFYQLEGRVAGLGYVLLVSAGNDGRGAVDSVQRILRGLALKPLAEPLRVTGPPTPADLDAARELGAAIAAGLVLGIF